MKTILSAFILVFVLFVSACICPSSNQGGDVSVTENTQQSGGGQGVTTTLAQNTGGGSQVGGQKVTTTQAQGGGGGALDNALNDISSAITSGLAYQCTYTYMEVKSDILVKGKKFKATVKSGPSTINEISDGVWVYVWGEGESTGTKFKIQDMEQNQGDASANSYTSPEDIQTSAIDVRCVPSAASDSAFNPPGNVQFTDFSSLQNDVCAICNMIPDAQQKADCLAGCNSGG